MFCYSRVLPLLSFFFFNDTATTEIYTLSLHDALPIYQQQLRGADRPARHDDLGGTPARDGRLRSEEHTSELQSRQYLVCRLLLEKKKKTKNTRQQTAARGQLRPHCPGTVDRSSHE